MSGGSRGATVSVERGLILIADDDDVVRQVLREMLEELGYSVISAADSAETLQQFADHTDDVKLIILDYKMPGLSGSEVFDRLKQTDPQVNVLLSSGHSDTIDLDELRKKGLKGFLAKPYSFQDIRDKITEIIGPREV